jgi:hypothetical protein
VGLEERRAQYTSREHREGRAKALASAKPTDLCPRCLLALGPIRPELLDYDHNDDRTGYQGLSHKRCNRSAGARNGAAATNALRRGETYRPVVDW